MQQFEKFVEGVIFKSRWLLAPFFLGLVLGIVLLFIKFIQELWYMVTHVFEAKETEVIIEILILVDMALVASLLLMIIFSGYEIFVSKINVYEHEDKPDWMGKVDFSSLKLKVIGSIVAISAIDLLKTFMNMPDQLTTEDSNTIMWKAIIHMVFVLSGVLFAITDKVAGDTKKH